MKQHAASTQEIKSFSVAPLVKSTVRTLHVSAPGLNNQGERSHSTTADAAKKVISRLGHRRSLPLLSMKRWRKSLFATLLGRGNCIFYILLYAIPHISSVSKFIVVHTGRFSSCRPTQAVERLTRCIVAPITH